MDWEENKKAEIKRLTSQGTIPVSLFSGAQANDLTSQPQVGMDLEESEHRPFLMGKTAAVVNDVKPAKEIVDEMVAEAVQCLKASSSYVVHGSKL